MLKLDNTIDINHKCLYGLYLIADFSFTKAQATDIYTALLRPGVALLQYRDKQANPIQRKQRAQILNELCIANNIPLIINDDVELALKIDAAGVHLGENDMSPKLARAMLGTEKIIGVSCYQSLKKAQFAQAANADYVAFGALFPSPTKPEAKLISLQQLSAYKHKLDIPVCAIGGINQHNIRQIFATGVDMAALISSVFGTHNPSENINALIADWRHKKPAC